jgi:hypothetical protein
MTVLHVVFTMDCQPAHTRFAPEGPKNWLQSALAIDSFCSALSRYGYQPTLFLTPSCAAEHEPLLREKSDGAVDLGLYLQPQSLPGGQYGRYLGEYSPALQREIVTLARTQYQDVLGARPLSVRSAMYSASDSTFAVLAELGFRQSSLSSPGRQVRPHAADWVGADPDAHFAHPSNRLRSGELPLLEVPATTDATQRRGGVAPDLTIEAGRLETYHRPLIEGQLQRMENQSIPFRAVVFTTRNCFSFDRNPDEVGKVLEEILVYLQKVGETAEIRPASLAAVRQALAQGG